MQASREIDDVESPSSDNAEEQATEREMMEDEMLSAVLALPIRRRQIVLLRLCAGYSTEETAAVLHCSTGTVKAALHQAKRHLQALGLPTYAAD